MKDEYPIEDWWSEPEVQIVQDSSINWERKTFIPIAGFWVPTENSKFLGKLSQHEQLPAGAIIDNTAWDHEHCALCFEKISAYKDHQHEGYTNGEAWLCIECFNKYILPRR